MSANNNIFDQFNARTLPPEKVAKSFIPPDQFTTICSHSHTSIVGPRGSGKTSLLKMLHPAALTNWHGSYADNIKRTINYTGVFIPSDIAWNKQALSFVDGLAEEEQKIFRMAAFTTRVLHELIEVIIYRTSAREETNIEVFRAVNLDREAERRVVGTLANAWKLNPHALTFRSLKHTLSARNIEIWRLAQERHIPDRLAVGDLPEWLFLDFFSCATHAIEVFDDEIMRTSDTWALLFDEVELLPEWLLNGLLKALRSTNEKILFKLAISPFDHRYEVIRTALESMPDQDYREVILWHPNKETGHAFSERLFLSICQGRDIAASSVTQILGPSLLEEGNDANAYKPGSLQHDILTEALRIDSSFKRHWIRHNINVDRIAELPEWKRASKVRKVYPIVAIRMFFKKYATDDGQDPRQRFRGRKSKEIYAGGDSILTITEGNPRWLIGMTRLLLDFIDNPKKEVPLDKQSAQIEEASLRFRARIQTISLAPLHPLGKASNLIELIDIIGNYFQQRILDDKFRPEPALSFKVDDQVSQDLQTAIGRALNVGALVHLPEPGEQNIFNSVTGRRFRISYMLASYYKLPTRIGSSISLSHILSNTDQEQDETLPLFNSK